MIYLDHAATSHPKPSSVLAAMQHWYEDLGVSADRGDSHRCIEVGQRVRELRQRLGALCGAPAERIAFTSGATESLNLALRALLTPGDTVLTTAFEHSSVVRPLRALARERNLRIEVLAPTATGGLDPGVVRERLMALRPRLFVFTHASNVTGALFEAAAFCGFARATGTITLLDASQSAGFCDLAVGADVLVASGHKALHGPPGLGFLAVSTSLDLPAQKQGGTGSSLALDEQPTTWPQAFEAGTPNTPAMFGLLAAMQWNEAAGPGALAATALARTLELEQLLAAKPGVRLLRPPGSRTPVLSFVHTDFDAAEIAGMLAAAEVHVRSGFHCAPWIHRHLGTERAGTVRMSPGPQISADDIAAAAAAVPD